MATLASMKEAVVKSIPADPHISHLEEIAVLVDGVAVILRGTVGTFSQRHAAARAASRVQVVDIVGDRLVVRRAALRRRAARSGAAGDLLGHRGSGGALRRQGDRRLDAVIGTVPWQFESDAVLEDVAKLFSVIGVTNQIRVLNP